MEFDIKGNPDFGDLTITLQPNAARLCAWSVIIRRHLFNSSAKGGKNRMKCFR